jgi:xylulokinase
MYLLGIDFGSTMVKTSLVKIEEGQEVESSFAPPKGMQIESPFPGWAEQNPELWWKNVCKAIHEVIDYSGILPAQIKAIGIAYQMHGLIMLDEDNQIIYPSILWCDSRSSEIGKTALNELGRNYCLTHLLNSPGNFTASKLKWIKENKPEEFKRIRKIMFPGDYIAFKMSGKIQTTISGLSEGIFWDFKEHKLSNDLLDFFGLKPEMIPDIVENFHFQAEVNVSGADEMGLRPGIPITYRAGDQINNAWSSKVLEPGQLFAQVGTSGVILSISDQFKSDPSTRINTFAHVNHQQMNPRLALLLCTNGTGMMNKWIAKQLVQSNQTTEEMRRLENEIPIGANGLMVFPFGNGAERLFHNHNLKAQILGLDLNQHGVTHIVRATSEGIAYALNYGLEIIRSIHPDDNVIRAYKSKIFTGRVFRHALSAVSGSSIEFYNNEGAKGAALAAGIGAGIYKNVPDAFRDFYKVDEVFPETREINSYKENYEKWKEALEEQLKVLETTN